MRVVAANDKLIADRRDGQAGPRIRGTSDPAATRRRPSSGCRGGPLPSGQPPRETEGNAGAHPDTRDHDDSTIGPRRETPRTSKGSAGEERPEKPDWAPGQSLACRVEVLVLVRTTALVGPPAKEHHQCVILAVAKSAVNVDDPFGRVEDADKGV